MLRTHEGRGHTLAQRLSAIVAPFIVAVTGLRVYTSAGDDRKLSCLQ